jgi:hypothetical protein
MARLIISVPFLCMGVITLITCHPNHERTQPFFAKIAVALRPIKKNEPDREIEYGKKRQA